MFQPLGGAHLIAGEHKLTITVVGKHPDSLGYQAGVDYLTVTPINNVTAATITDAMNNDGISSDGTPATFDLGGTSLSAQTLAAAGYAPGSTVTIDGATFTMPAARSDGADNVIAIGQKIPFPTAVSASAVGLLVAATCGRIPAGNATITYTGAQDIVDLATALRDPANPNLINPTYLTNATPNPTYHDTIAQTIADAASRFPPEARL